MIFTFSSASLKLLHIIFNLVCTNLVKNGYIQKYIRDFTMNNVVDIFIIMLQNNKNYHLVSGQFL